MVSYLFHDPGVSPSRFRRYRIALLRTVRRSVIRARACMVTFYIVAAAIVLALAAYSAYLQSVTP